MEFPQRSATHKIEARSWKMLQHHSPDHWIVREVSERDYGIDAYIEIASKSGDVTGNLLSIQLKGVSELKWPVRKSATSTIRSPSIKTSTANYWFNLPVPVFLFVADLAKNQIYYSPVEETMRSQFDLLSKQDSISFKLHSELSITSETGAALFDWFVARERAFPQFAFHISNLINNLKTFDDFIAENQNRDCFMEIESERHLQFRALYESCHMAAIYLEREWTLESLPELYKKDHAQWKDNYVYLHEETLDYALQKLEKIFPRLVRQALKLVNESQSAFWCVRDPVFHSLCSSEDLSWSLKHMESRLQR